MPLASFVSPESVGAATILKVGYIVNLVGQVGRPPIAKLAVIGGSGITSYLDGEYKCLSR